MGKYMKVEANAFFSEDALFDAVCSLGFKIFREGEGPKEKREDLSYLVRFIISACVLVPLLYFAFAAMFGGPLGLLNTEENAQWLLLLELILCGGIIGINYKYFTHGTMAVFKRAPNMDTLVTLGAGSAYIYSLVLTILVFIGAYTSHESWYMFHEDVMFEAPAMILTIVDIGKWLEELSKRKTGDSVEKLLKLAPDTVTVERDGELVEIASKEVEIGDIVVVREGDRVPVDGTVSEGEGFVDKSAITGESVPVEVKRGTQVVSPSMVVDGTFKIRADKVGEETTLYKIVEMVRDAGASKAPIQKFADRVASVFVPIVSLLAIITLFVWLMVVGAFIAFHCINFAICVLVISCPCALGLATPVAIMTAAGKGAQNGILYKDAETIQKNCDCNTVLLDKTATITEGKIEVNDFRAFEFGERVALDISYGLEVNSNHPIAAAITKYAVFGAKVSDFKYVTGRGATGRYNGKTYTIGNAKFAGLKMTAEAERFARNLSMFGNTPIYLSDERRVVAIFSVADRIKEDSREAVALLKDRKFRVSMVTGDTDSTANAVASAVGIDDYIADTLPEDKLRAVVSLQSAGGVVAMVGDGINDSPALKQADIGIAMGRGTDIAIDSADIILVTDDLRAVDTAIDLGKATMRNVKQNLFWAIIYNVIMIPVAAGCFYALDFFLSPAICAACMCVSSLFVVGNAMRLRRYRNKRLSEEDARPKKKEKKSKRESA